jgi:hypothetical protein
MYVHMHIQSYTVCSTADNSWVIALSFLAGPCGIYSGATRGIRIVNENRAFEHLCVVQAFNPSPSFSNAQIPSNPGNYDMRNSQYDMVWPETGLIRLLHCRTASNTHGKFFSSHMVSQFLFEGSRLSAPADFWWWPAGGRGHSDSCWCLIN